MAGVPLGTGNTPSTKLGDWMGWLAMAGLIFFTVFQMKIGRKH